jgi:hypothetical protein
MYDNILILIPWELILRQFEAFRYEVGNMDHSFMQGVEVVDRLLTDGEENTINGSTG